MINKDQHYITFHICVNDLFRVTRQTWTYTVHVARDYVCILMQKGTEMLKELDIESDKI